MFEIGLVLTASAAMGKIADADGRSAAQWVSSRSASPWRACLSPCRFCG